MNKVSIVTAMFNINRAEWNGFERSTEKYLSYFEFWVRIKNELVCYVDNELIGEKVLAVRSKFGLENLTKTIVIDDYQKLDQSLYDSVKIATENSIQIDSRMRPRNPESWNANYNYVMMLKGWCVSDAIKNGYVTSDDVAWIDFGFGHGTESFLDPIDFDFEWLSEFEDKIYLFNVQPLDDRPIFDIIKSMDTYFMGPIIFGKAGKWAKFYELMRNAMISLNDSGLADDDQVIMLMAYRKNPEMFHVEASSWFIPLVDYSKNKIRLNTTTVADSLIKRIIKKTPLKRIYQRLSYRGEVVSMLGREYRHFEKIIIH